MSTLIDALKVLLSHVDDYDPSGGSECEAKLLATEVAHRIREIIAEHERSAEPVKCKCGSEPNADHPCPYKSEINDNSEDLCNCCDDCRHECCMDI